MLSKILTQSDGDVHPVTWRSSSSAVARPPISSPIRTPASAWTTVPAMSTPPPIGAPAPLEAELEAQVHQQLQVAFDSGFKEGEAAARQKLEANVRGAVEQLTETAAEVAASRVEIIRRAETDVLRLSMEIARRILHRELTVDSAALSALIRAALEKLAAQQVSRVRVHPDQAQLVQASLAQMGRAADVEVISDTTQPRGGALFEAEGGTLDASVETQLQEIERGFADRLQERP